MGYLIVLVMIDSFSLLAEQLKQHGVMGYVLLAILSLFGWVARGLTTASPVKTTRTQQVLGALVIGIPIGVLCGDFVSGWEVSEKWRSLQYIAAYVGATASRNIVFYLVNTNIKTVFKDVKEFLGVIKK